jgi:hypothetical protein
MKYRRKFAALWAILLISTFVVIYYQSDIIGWWRGEAKYQGKYTNYWERELQDFRVQETGPSGHDVRFGVGIHRTPKSKWEEWCQKLITGFLSNPRQKPPLQNGDPDALAVLVELLRSGHRDVRIIAALGLEEIGPKAGTAVPALLAALEDEERLVVYFAWYALKEIDSAAAWENSGRFYILFPP